MEFGWRASFRVFAIWIVFFSLAQSALAEGATDWAGTWDARWRGGGGQLQLQQSGQDVTGIYMNNNGRVVGKADGPELRGDWSQGDKHGQFILVLSPDGQSFMGRLEGSSREWWTGVRRDTSKYDFVRINQSSPTAVMASFLQAFNESGADRVYRADGGSLGLASKAAGLVLASEADRAGLSQIDYARVLFDVIDRLTFRIAGLPGASTPQDEVTVTLDQFDSPQTFDLTFRRVDKAWYIVGPPLAELEAKRSALAAARGAMADVVDDPAALRSPRDAFKTLLGGLNGGNPEASMKALDMRSYSPAVRADEARLLSQFLKQVLDRVGYVFWQELPDDPQSKAPFVFLEHPAGDIVVGPVETDDGVIWQFTQGTLADIRGLYADVENLPVAPEFGPAAETSPYFAARSVAQAISPALLVRAGPIERWQWLLLFLVGLLGFALGYVASLIVVLRRRRRMRKRVKTAGREGLLDWSLYAIGVGLALSLALPVLGLPELVATPVLALAWSAILVGAVPVCWVLIGRVADMYRSHFTVPGYHETLISLLTGVARVVMVVVAFLLLAEVLAIPYQGVIAGLGIGGLAVALAAQPTLQNFLSGITLYADRPISVGDFCKFGDKMGTIEHIGMRSTRIRTPERTIISVPNAEFSTMQIENFARRDRALLKTVIELRRDATPDQLRYALAELRALLIGHPRIGDDPRVRLIGIAETGYELEVFAYVMTANGLEFLGIREDILLRILDVLSRAGVQLAMPERVEYRKDDIAPDPLRREAAESEVASWRQDGRLPFPDFDPQGKAALRDRLAYPPEGSPAARVAEPGLPLAQPADERGSG
jgi:MscS family membrane protein